jgi:hypothetical protein
MVAIIVVNNNHPETELDKAPNRGWKGRNIIFTAGISPWFFAK